MNLDTLMQKARDARPKSSNRREKWARLWDAYAQLRANGMSCREAVAWLVKEKAVPKESEERALQAFHMMAHRRNKKTKNA